MAVSDMMNARGKVNMVEDWETLHWVVRKDKI